MDVGGGRQLVALFMSVGYRVSAGYSKAPGWGGRHPAAYDVSH